MVRFMENDKEENEMAVSALTEQYILDEQAAKRIISASPIKLPKSNEFNDLYLSDKDRIAHASNVLKSRKFSLQSCE